MDDPIRPDYYGGAGETHETMAVMEAWDPIATLGFCRMSAIKYLSRVGAKDGCPAPEDYRKASWYANRAAEIYERLRRSQEKDLEEGDGS